jgi:hypothetical protein
MNMKTCLDCKNEYTDNESKNFGRCPKCDSKFYTVGTITDPDFSSRTPSEIEEGNRLKLYTPTKTAAEIAEDERVKYEKSIGPENVKKFKNRLKLELEEIAYQEWRAMQPEWKHQVARVESNPKAQPNINGLASSQAAATALGVFVGTTAIRAQLAELNENLDDASGGESGDSGDSEGGFMDSLGDFF